MLEQDEEDTNSKPDGALTFEASSGFAIHSAATVGVYGTYEIYIKGDEGGDIYSHEFLTEQELNTYITRLKQAVKEFNAAGGFAKTPKETVEIIE